MSKNVTYAKLQTELYAPSVGNIGTTLPSSHKSLQNLKMVSSEESLYVTFTYQGREKTFEIPKGNVVLMELDLAPRDNSTAVSTLEPKKMDIPYETLSRFKIA